MRQLLKSIVQSGLDRIGYEIRCTRSIPSMMRNPDHVVELSFRHVVTELMHRIDRTQLCFLQVGAFDGVSCDPLREFVEKYNWQGILVEPQPTAFQQLVANYEAQSGLIFRNCAVAKERGQLELFTVTGDHLPTWCGGLAGFSRESIEKHEPFAPGISECIVSMNVPTVPFSDLLSELPTALDLLQIDTEGFDTQLLEMFPFAQCQPSIIHFERKHLTPSALDECLRKLATFGYRFAFDGGEDMLALRDGQVSV
jgi:FkbM family methyltransferase